MSTETTEARTITRELGGWRDKSGKAGGHHSGRVFLIAQIGPDDLNPGDKTTTAHEPIAGPCRQVTYSIDFRSRLDTESWTRGEDAIESLAQMATLTVPSDFPHIVKAIRLLERWHLNTMRGTCAHAPEGSHICPGKGYGCECCPNTAPPTVDMSGGVGIVRGGSRSEASARCEHDVIGKDYGCGYKQGHGWLVEPLTEDAEAEIRAALERITRAGVSHG